MAIYSRRKYRYVEVEVEVDVEVQGAGYYSILLVSCVMWSGVLDRSGVL